MTTMRALTFPLTVLLLIVLYAVPAAAVVRRVDSPLLWRRTAVSGYLGVGVPVGVFASSKYPGDGNHETGALDWTLEIEHFVARTVSVGFSVAHTVYQDKTFADSETHLATYSGFFRAVIPTATEVRPYLRAGVGGVDLSIEDIDGRHDADTAWSMQFGGGLIYLPVRWLALNAQVLYYWGSTEDALLPHEMGPNQESVVVGFDTQYFAFSGGVSLLFP